MTDNSTNESGLGICSYNCNGLADHKKRKLVFMWLKEKTQAIFCLQETHSLELDEEKWKKEWDGPIFFSHGRRNSKGVMILIKKQFDFQWCSVERDMQGRWLILNIIVYGQNLCILNLYGPNKDEPLFFEELYYKLQEQQGEIILVGDFNIVLNNVLDRKGNTFGNYHPQALHKIQNIIDSYDLVDIWRLTLGEGKIKQAA